MREVSPTQVAKRCEDVCLEGCEKRGVMRGVNMGQKRSGSGAGVGASRRCSEAARASGEAGCKMRGI